MPNLSQQKRERMMAFLRKIKDEHRDDDEMLIAPGEMERNLSFKYGNDTKSCGNKNQIAFYSSENIVIGNHSGI